MSDKICGHCPNNHYHCLLGKKAGGFQCYCGKIRNTLRSLHRHIKQISVRP
jgi:hypothetical protein